MPYKPTTDLFRATTLYGREFPAQRTGKNGPLLDSRTHEPVPKADLRGTLLQFVTQEQHDAMVDADAQRMHLEGQAARTAYAERMLADAARPTPPVHLGLTKQADDTWTGETPSAVVPDNAATATGDDGRSEVWVEGGFIVRRNMHSSRTVAVQDFGSGDLWEPAEGGEWVPEPEQTPPAPTAPQAPTLDELTGAITEAAEHGDWRAVHAYTLELAALAASNIK